MFKTPGTDFHEVYKNNMDENSCIKNINDVMPTLVRNEKIAGLVAESDGRSTEEYKKCQVYNIVLCFSASVSK